VKIKEIRAIEIETAARPTTQPRTQSRAKTIQMARPISRYRHVIDYPTSKRVACVVTAEDGTWGFGLTVHGGPVAGLINDHFAPALVGQNAMAIEKLWDAMVRMTAPFGGPGVASYAISAIDTALWDLKGKLLERPVYELLGGPQKEKIFCYATGFDTEWYMELGFKGTKLFAPWGPDDGLEGLRKNEDFVATTRETVGDDVELMLDCWMTPNGEYAVQLAERLRPYQLKWIEEYAPPDDLETYANVRQRIPWQTLASGEHWYLLPRFFTAASQRLVDIFQPDVLWCGGITAAVKICHIAEAAGITVIPHASMNYPYGQHLVFALPAAVWGERSEGVSAPGIPLEEMTQLPGTPAIVDGYLVPSDAPGFGLEITREWIEEAAAR
jgi:L-rhamnonate dehydratase